MRNKLSRFGVTAAVALAAAIAIGGCSKSSDSDTQQTSTTKPAGTGGSDGPVAEPVSKTNPVTGSRAATGTEPR